LFIGALVWLANLCLGAIALCFLLPVLVLLIECMAAVWLSPRAATEMTATPRTAVLVPAHNEALGIRPVLDCLLPQLNPTDRLIVIADNCTDETAAIARELGAIAIERSDAVKRGKGYAIDFGVRYLEADPPEVVAIVDADCRVDAGGLGQITRQAMATGRPAQAIYLMERPESPDQATAAKTAVSSLAFMVKNLVRPTGLSHLNLPCHLTGTGMAFPWQLLRTAPLASGNIVEDIQLGIDLAIAGAPTQLCEGVTVYGLLPRQEQVAKGQRTRWEHGHLQTLMTQVPVLVKAALEKRRFDLLALGLNIAIPPLSLLVMLLLGATGLACLAALLGASRFPAIALLVESTLMFTAILSAWAKFGRQEIPAQALLSIPLYILWKIPLYLSFLKKPEKQWIRTERDGAN
jgi:cellulose synthase/poly-beta-1,6-N-acetylglucosamine synthase-like glycosyltransferase